MELQIQQEKVLKKMNARFGLYLILVIALLSSLSLVLFVKYNSYKQQMIIVQPASDRNGILHPPSNYQKKDEKTTNTAGQRVHDASKSDTETKLEEQTTPIASTDNFNVRKIDTKKKNYKTSVIDGFYDDRIDTLETQNNVKSVVEDQPIDATTDSELSLKIGVAQCRNTKQGAEYITDSLGYVCSIMHVDPKTQCCKHIDDEQARKDGFLL